MGINEDGRAFHELARSKGWWDDPALQETCDRVAQKLDYMLSDRGLNQGDIGEVTDQIMAILVAQWPKRNAGELMMLMVSEIAEAFEEYRAGTLDTIYTKDGKPEGGVVELADLYIRLGDFVASRGMDLEYAINLKHQFNATRPHRHGGKLA